MRHEDFSTLEMGEVLSRVIQFAQNQSGAKEVHWLSATTLKRVAESSNDQWHWDFAVHEDHVWNLLPVWQKALVEFARLPSDRPALFKLDRQTYFVCRIEFQGRLLGAFLFCGLTQKAAMALSAGLSKSKLKKGLTLASRYIAFAQSLLAAKNESYLDELTGLYNQRYLPLVLENEIQRAKREKKPFSLLFLDIDFFKLVNDGRGHWVGSKLLTELGRVLKEQVRTSDFAFRYGGDEFVILLTNSDAMNSTVVAERMRRAVESHHFVVEGHPLKLTVSIGLACFPKHATTAAGLIQLADQAMYHGKRKSRNIVFVAS